MSLSLKGSSATDRESTNVVHVREVASAGLQLRMSLWHLVTVVRFKRLQRAVCFFGRLESIRWLLNPVMKRADVAWPPGWAVLPVKEAASA